MWFWPIEQKFLDFLSQGVHISPRIPEHFSIALKRKGHGLGSQGMKTEPRIVSLVSRGDGRVGICENLDHQQQ